MAWTFVGGGQGGGGEISPGSGSTGFTSRQVPFVNSSGQLTADSSGMIWDSTSRTLTVPGTLSLSSTVNISTAVGTSGGAAAPPANPQVYLKALAVNAAGTLTTLYIPAYNSTG